jgi:dihydroorotase
MKLLIRDGRVIDPATGLDTVADVAVAAGRIIAIQPGLADGGNGNGFTPDRVIGAQGCIVAPGLVDLSVRLREPGQEHLGMLESEMAAAVAGGVTSLVCPPDTEPVLDEPGLVNMLKYRAEKLHLARLFPLGALTKGLRGEALTEMVELTDAGCVGFGQAEVPIVNTQVLLRTLQYAATFDYTVWLRPQDAWLGQGVAASGPLATRMGLSGVPVAAELIALHTLFELVRSTRARVHLCRISSAAGVELVRMAKAEGLPITCDVSVHNLHLIDVDVGHFDSRTRLSPPLRQQRDRDALRAALADGTIDALVSDHTPVDDDAKTLPFAEAEVGATAVELLLSLAAHGSHGARHAQPIDWMRTLRSLTHGPAQVLGHSLGTLQASVGRLSVGGMADVCVFDPQAWWTVRPQHLRSQGRHTPFAQQELPAVVRHTLVAGQVAFECGPASSP